MRTSLRVRPSATTNLAPIVAAMIQVFAVAAVTATDWLGPANLVTSPDGESLLVTCLDAKRLVVVDLDSGELSKTIPMPANPTGIVFSPDGTKLYVTCASPESVVAIVDMASGRVTGKIEVGHTAVGPSISPDGTRLFVCNRFDSNVSVVELGSGKEIDTIPVTREPIASALTPDGTTLVVPNHLPLDPSDSHNVAAEVALINTATGDVRNLRLPIGSTGLRDVCIAPDGKFAYVPHILARYRVPTTQLERGWMNTNAVTIIDLKNQETLNTVLLDNVDLGAAVPWGVAVSADSKTVCVSHSGAHEVSIIDAEELIRKLLSLPLASDDKSYSGNLGTTAGVRNDLAFLVGLRRRVTLPGNGPRGLVIAGKKLYVAEYFSDTLATVELNTQLRKAKDQIALGPPPKLTVQRRGEMLFHDADLCFQHWQSCASCHPDARVDGLNWDLMSDGLGSPRNVRTMLLAHKTPPSMFLWARSTAEVAVRAGLTHVLFAVRPEEEAVAIDEYLKALKPVPSPLLESGTLSQAAERGRKVFESVGCAQCHPAPLYTDLKRHNVESTDERDRETAFDTPSLVECWRTAPYMHNGHYTTMKELLTEGQHGKVGGPVEELGEREIDDLVEFVLSL